MVRIDQMALLYVHVMVPTSSDIILAWENQMSSLVTVSTNQSPTVRWMYPIPWPQVMQHYWTLDSTKYIIWNTIYIYIIYIYIIIISIIIYIYIYYIYIIYIYRYITHQLYWNIFPSHRPGPEAFEYSLHSCRDHLSQISTGAGYLCRDPLKLGVSFGYHGYPLVN